MTTSHVLPPHLVESLCGGGSAPEIELFVSAQFSKRLVQLRALLDLVETEAPEDGRTADLRGSFAALAKVQREDPSGVADLLRGPQVGAWAAHCLRRLTGSPTSMPHWLDLAHLGAVAAAAAVRAGMDIEVLVPVRAGRISLPTLGCATVDRMEQQALATCRTGDPLLVDGLPVLTWQPLRRLGKVLLDDIDPYWRCFDLPIGPSLNDVAVARWRRQIDAAWGILAQRHQHWVAGMTAAVRCLVPVERKGVLGGLSATSGDAPGAVALTEQVIPERLAATLVHEVQHFRLNSVHALVPLFRSSSRDLLYSPWRNDPRPLAGVLHGTYAFLGVADFWSREWSKSGSAAELMYARTVRQLRAGHVILTGAENLTPLGTALVAELGAAIRALPDDGLAVNVLRLADDLVAQHRALWQLRNVMVDPASVSRFVDEWLDGRPITATTDPITPTSGSVVPGGDSPLFRLATAWLADPEALHDTAGDAEAFRSAYPGAVVADLPLLAGDYATVCESRIAEIIDGAAVPEAWASLAVAHGRLVTGGSPLAASPELIRAALPRMRAAAGPHRDPLTELTSRYVAGTSTSDSMRR